MRWPKSTIITCTVLALTAAAVIGYRTTVAPPSVAESIASLEAPLAQEEAKLNAMVLPKLEEVGREAYSKAAQTNSAQGLKVKKLQVKIGRLQRELAGPNPIITKEEVEGRLHAAWAAFLDDRAEYRRDPSSADAAKYLPVIERKLVVLERTKTTTYRGRNP